MNFYRHVTYAVEKASLKERINNPLANSLMFMLQQFVIITIERHFLSYRQSQVYSENRDFKKICSLNVYVTVMNFTYLGI